MCYNGQPVTADHHKVLVVTYKLVLPGMYIRGMYGIEQKLESGLPTVRCEGQDRPFK